MSLGWREACEFVQERRSVVAPNFSFVGQLFTYEGMVRERAGKFTEKFSEQFGEKFGEKFSEKFSEKYKDKIKDTYKDTYKDALNISETIQKSFVNNLSQKYYESSWSENK